MSTDSTGEPQNPEGAREGFLRRAWGVFLGIVRMRCPRCRQGRMFRGPLTMNDPCPVCGLLYQREEGTFLGAMYASYVLSFLLLGLLYLLSSWLLPERSGYLVSLVALLMFVPLMPAVFRYSRVLWIYFERFGAPSDLSAGAYEKYRRRQIEEQQAADATKPPNTPSSL